MANITDDLEARLSDLLASMKQALSEKNPFEDGTDFETFISLKYDEIFEDDLANTNLNTPLNIFKFMLIKMNPIMGNILAPGHFKKMLVTLREVKAKYLEFESKIPMSPRELKYVKSAHAALELGEMAIVAQEEGSQNKAAFGSNSKSRSNMNVEKLKQTCIDILDANNPIGEGLIGFLALLRNQMNQERRFEIIRFSLCVMEEGMKRVRKVRTEQGLIPENPWMKDLMQDTEMLVCHLKLKFLALTFGVSSTVHEIGPALYLEILPNGEEDDKTLVQAFEKYAGHDEMCKISLKIVSFNQAKEIYELMLKLSSNIESSEKLKLDYKKELFEGLALCYFAVYHTDPEEIYRLSESSLNLLQFVRKKEENDKMSKNSNINGTLLVAVEVNLRRMWNIKYGIYQKNKTPENLTELKKNVTNRLVLANAVAQRCFNVNSTYNGWWVYFDSAKCMFLVYNDQICARKMLQLAHMELMKEPDQIQVFNNNIKGINLDRKMSKEAFVTAVFEKFDPNVEIKEKNPYEDGTSFKDFTCMSYEDISEEVLDKANLKNSLDIYKSLAIRSKNVYSYNPENKEKNAQMQMDKFKRYKKAYKDSMRQEISMTVEERKYIRSAYNTIRLAEMYFKYFDSKPQEFQLENFDFQKLKIVCCDILEGCIQVIPLMHLLEMFSMFWSFESFEICRFLLCVMAQIKKKTRAIHKENQTFVNNCTCVFFTIREFDMRVNLVNLVYLNYIFCLSSFNYTISAVCSTLERPSKQSEIGKTLMELFENYEGDEEEFQEIPNKADNYDQAKMIFDLIMTLTSERKFTEKPQHIFDSYYYQGVAHSCLATFLLDSVEVYKLCEKSVELLQKYLDFDKIKYKAIQIGKIDHIVGAMDVNYRLMERIKYEIYKQDKTHENYLALNEVAAKRIKWGNKFLTEFVNPDWLFKKFWTRVSLIKCHLQVKEDQTAAKKCAVGLYNELLDKSNNLEFVEAVTGIEFNRKMSKENFVEYVIQKYNK